MQGKEVSEQETAKCTAGIDVSKNWLDVHVLPASQSLRVANTSGGICQLKRWLIRFDPKLVVIEATGKWHRVLCRSLAASQVPLAIVNPYRVRMFAEAQGILAKTDQLDAKVLAMFAVMMAPPARAPSSEMLEVLQELITARDSAVAEETALRNQRSAAQARFLKPHFARRIAQLKSHIKALEKECLRLIKTDDALARRFAILLSVPSFGAVVAMTLIARLPELGSITNKQISALAGMAPLADDSGNQKGIRVIRGGRGPVRRMLYLAALTAAHHDETMQAFYLRLTSKGRASKAALVAVARKLVVLANTLIAQDRLWQPIAPQNA